MKVIFFGIAILVLLLLALYFYFHLKRQTRITANQNQFAAASSSSFNFWLTSCIILMIAGISFSIYLSLGSINQLNLTQSNDQKLRIKFTKALGRLSNQINENPNNPYSWYLLAEGHFKLGQIDLADKYVNQAYELDLADSSVDYGEILLLYAKVLGAREGDFKNPRSFDFLKQAYEQLELQSQNYQTLSEFQKQKINSQQTESAWLLGFAYFNNTQLDEALKVWRELDDVILNENQRQIVNQAINEAEVYQQNMFQLNLTIEVDSELYQQISPRAVLFVTLKEQAKEFNQSQAQQQTQAQDSHLNNQIAPFNQVNSMPIAVKREINLTFPKQIILNQNDLLAPSRSKPINRNQLFSLQAFISQDGIANFKTGDLTSSIKQLNRLDQSDVSKVLLINKVYTNQPSK